MISERPQSTTSGDDPQLLEDLFHALSQPLTTLRCCLSLVLQKSADDQPNRKELEIAWQAAESVSGLVGSIRELTRTRRCLDSATADLRACLLQTVDDLRPVAESARFVLSVECDLVAQVAMDATDLRRAFFHLLEYACTCCRAGSKLTITMTEAADRATITLRATHASTAIDVPPPQLERRVALAVAGCLFKSAGGSLQSQVSPIGFHLRIELPRRPESVSSNLRVSQPCA